MKIARKFQIITLFPEMFDKVLNSSMMWKAQKEKLAQFTIIDLRDFGIGSRRQVDDVPYGGGDGMLLKIEPLTVAIEHAKTAAPHAKVILTSPSDTVWNQAMARSFADSSDDYIIICGHYEGYDARVERMIDTKISVGDYVLTGGELPAMMIIDSIVRLIPGVLGGENSAEIESFSHDGYLEFPQYTRPEEFRGQKVPDVLLSGNHAKIAEWRRENSSKTASPRLMSD